MASKSASLRPWDSSHRALASPSANPRRWSRSPRKAAKSAASGKGRSASKRSRHCSRLTISSRPQRAKSRNGSEGLDAKGDAIIDQNTVLSRNKGWGRDPILTDPSHRSSGSVQFLSKRNRKTETSRPGFRLLPKHRFAARMACWIPANIFQNRHLLLEIIPPVQFIAPGLPFIAISLPCCRPCGLPP